MKSNAKLDPAPWTETDQRFYAEILLEAKRTKVPLLRNPMTLEQGYMIVRESINSLTGLTGQDCHETKTMHSTPYHKTEFLLTLSEQQLRHLGIRGYTIYRDVCDQYQISPNYSVVNGFTELERLALDRQTRELSSGWGGKIILETPDHQSIETTITPFMAKIKIRPTCLESIWAEEREQARKDAEQIFANTKYLAITRRDEYLNKRYADLELRVHRIPHHTPVSEDTSKIWAFETVSLAGRLLDYFSVVRIRKPTNIPVGWKRITLDESGALEYTRA